MEILIPVLLIVAILLALGHGLGFRYRDRHLLALGVAVFFVVDLLRVVL